MCDFKYLPIFISLIFLNLGLVSCGPDNLEPDIEYVPDSYSLPEPEWKTKAEFKKSEEQDNTFQSETASIYDEISFHTAKAISDLESRISSVKAKSQCVTIGHRPYEKTISQDLSTEFRLLQLIPDEAIFNILNKKPTTCTFELTYTNEIGSTVGPYTYHVTKMTAQTHKDNILKIYQTEGNKSLNYSIFNRRIIGDTDRKDLFFDFTLNRSSRLKLYCTDYSVEAEIYPEQKAFYLRDFNLSEAIFHKNVESLTAAQVPNQICSVFSYNKNLDLQSTTELFKLELPAPKVTMTIAHQDGPAAHYGQTSLTHIKNKITLSNTEEFPVMVGIPKQDLYSVELMFNYYNRNKIDYRKFPTRLAQESLVQNGQKVSEGALDHMWVTEIPAKGSYTFDIEFMFKPKCKNFDLDGPIGFYYQLAANPPISVLTLSPLNPSMALSTILPAQTPEAVWLGVNADGLEKTPLYPVKREGIPGCSIIDNLIPR